ncbi:MAG: hypothetical protein ABW212_05240 [Pseudonocardia sediminis]
MLWNIAPAGHRATELYGRPELHLPGHDRVGSPGGASGAVIVDLHPGRLRPWALIGVVTVDPAGHMHARELSPADEHLGMAAECLRQWARATGTVGPVRIFIPAG